MPSSSNNNNNNNNPNTNTTSTTINTIASSYFHRIHGLLGILITNAEGILVDRAMAPQYASSNSNASSSPPLTNIPYYSHQIGTSFCASHLLSLEQANKLGPQYGHNRFIVSFFEQKESLGASNEDTLPADSSNHPNTHASTTSPSTTTTTTTTTEYVIVQYIWRGFNKEVPTAAAAAGRSNAVSRATSEGGSKSTAAGVDNNLTSPNKQKQFQDITQKFSEMMRQRDQHEMDLDDDALLFTFIMGSSSGGGGDSSTSRTTPSVGLMKELAPQIAESFASS